MQVTTEIAHRNFEESISSRLCFCETRLHVLLVLGHERKAHVTSITVNSVSEITIVTCSTPLNIPNANDSDLTGEHAVVAIQTSKVQDGR